MLLKSKFILPLASITLLSGCSLATFAPAGSAPDDRPYFEVFDGPGRACDVVKFDGVAWSHPNGVAIAISEGKHQFQCGGDVITFAIPKGMIYKFDFRKT